ncbi:M48 family metalloprotease [Sneathiella sp.]|uniref:M48 family metalloprotease n=1 Tax=Sneathiella sp. TaxID=1964365 RepID=UPI00300134D3
MIRPLRHFLSLAFVPFMLMSCAVPELPTKDYTGPVASEKEVKEAEASAKLLDGVNKNQLSAEQREEMMRSVYAKVSQSGSEVCATVSVRNFRYCRKFKLIVSDNPSLNSYPFDTSDINIHKDLLSYTDNEDEMALLIAHNMAHHLANHINEDYERTRTDFNTVKYKADMWLWIYGKPLSKSENPTGSGFEESGAHSYSIYQEYEADYLAAYLVNSAGYSIDKAIVFYEKMYFLNPKTGKEVKTEAGLFDTHPFSLVRIARLQNAAKEIAEKRNEKQPVVPNEDSSN